MKKKTPLVRRPWFEFLSSMRFAVALLTLLAIASIIGTVLQQNQPMNDYLVKFGPFWFAIFKTLGLFDVYAAPWFVLILVFLVLSLSLCLWRHTPTFMQQMRTFRLGATRQSLAAMRHSVVFDGSLRPEIVTRYLQVHGFQVKTKWQDDGSVLVAAKQGSASKLGYVFAHAAIVVICIGGLIDSNMGLNVGRMLGTVVPDSQSLMAKDFDARARLDEGTLSFRGNVTVSEGQAADVVFLNAGDGLVVQELPFKVQLDRFHVEYYDTGMPKNFASDLTVTDKATGAVQQATVKVNEPLMVNGVAIFQSSFGDGGSDLQFKAWDVRNAQADFANMDAKSMNTFPLTLNGETYQLEFDELRVLNVEDMSAPAAASTPTMQQMMHDVRSVNTAHQLQNVGPTMTYRVRDKTGVAHEYLAYMLPVEREGGRYFALGERASPADAFRWVMLPADREGDLQTFMWWRQGLADEAVRARAIAAAMVGIDEHVQPQFAVAVDNVLRLFAQGGYEALDGFIATHVAQTEQERMRQFFLQILQASSGFVLDEVLAQHGAPAWEHSRERAQFIADASVGLTDLMHMQAPIYLQLTDFKQLQASGLQLAKSPGRFWVYLGSLCLIIGTICMFYVREKRLWVYLEANTMRVAMSASRHERGLEGELAVHQQRLQQLQKDLVDEKQSSKHA